MAQALQSLNRLLNRLPPDNYKRLLPHLEPAPLVFRAVLVGAHKLIDFAYFPTRGMISAVTTMTDGTGIEVGNIGNEGVAGIPTALGVFTSPHKSMVQAAGEAMRIDAKVLAKACENDGPLRQSLMKYQTYFFSQVCQAVACNGLHSISQRCCRWLLMAHDRVQSDDLPLTHEFLSIMLAVRRVSVTLVLHPLEEQGLIRGGRGTITVLNRKGLERAACECYETIQDEYVRMMG